jgi:hypothetical protein
MGRPRLAASSFVRSIFGTKRSRLVSTPTRTPALVCRAMRRAENILTLASVLALMVIVLLAKYRWGLG